MGLLLVEEDPVGVAVRRLALVPAALLPDDRFLLAPLDRRDLLLRQQGEAGRGRGRLRRDRFGSERFRVDQFLPDRRGGGGSGGGFEGQEQVFEVDLQRRGGRRLRRLDRLDHLLQQAIAVVHALAPAPVAGQQPVELRLEVVDHRQHRRARLVRHPAALGRAEGLVDDPGQLGELLRGRQVEDRRRRRDRLQARARLGDRLRVPPQREDAIHPAPDAGEDYAACARHLEPVLNDVVRIGGSHAQREIIEDTFIVALMKSGELARAHAMLDARLHRRPSPRDTRWLAMQQ